MANEQLASYVRQQLAAGVAKEEIRKALASQGWNKSDINDVFAVVQTLAQTQTILQQSGAFEQRPVSIGKRVVAMVGYLVFFFIAYTVLANILVLGTVAAYFISGWKIPPGVFGLGKIIAFVAAVFLAWITGRYFRFAVFRKFEQPHGIHGNIPRVIFSVFSSLFILAFIFVLTPSTLGLFYKDIPPIDDSDLQLPTISIPDEQNALVDLTAAASAVDKAYDTQQLRDILSGKAWDAAFTAQAVAANAPALSMYATAASKPAFQDPASAKPDTLSVATILPPLAAFRTLGRLNGVASLYLERQGKGIEALQTGLVGVAVGDKIEKSQGFLIEWLVGIAVKEQALQTINLVLASSTINTKDLVSFASALKQYENDGAGLVKASKVEYYTQKSTIEDMAHGDASGAGDPVGGLTALSSQIDRTSFYFHPNQSISYLAGDVRQRITNAQTSCESLQTHDMEKVAPSNLWLLYFTPNAIGKVIHDITAASLDSTNIKRCQENTLLAAVRLSAGIKAYKQDQGKLPASLDELAPVYLDSLPADPFSGQAFKYDQTKGIIYSVGKNRHDVGGSTGDSWDQMENPTFSVAF